MGVSCFQISFKTFGLRPILFHLGREVFQQPVLHLISCIAVRCGPCAVSGRQDSLGAGRSDASAPLFIFSPASHHACEFPCTRCSSFTKESLDWEEICKRRFIFIATVRFSLAYLLDFESNAVSFVFDYAVLLHFGKLIAHGAAVYIQIIRQLLAVVRDQEGIASGAFDAFRKIGH